MKAMQQVLKEITITIAYLQQGNEAKPIVTTSNRNSKIPGDIELGNPNCSKKVRVLQKVRIKVKASIILPYASGAKEKCHMTMHNIGCRTVTSSKSVKRNIRKNRKSMKMKQL